MAAPRCPKCDCERCGSVWDNDEIPEWHNPECTECSHVVRTVDLSWGHTAEKCVKCGAHIDGSGSDTP